MVTLLEGVLAVYCQGCLQMWGVNTIGDVDKILGGISCRHICRHKCLTTNNNVCVIWYVLVFTCLVLIVDRSYRKWRTERKVTVMVGLTWVIPMAVFFPSIFGWQHFVGYRSVPTGKCYVQYMEDALFNCLLQVRALSPIIYTHTCTHPTLV